MDYWIVFGLLSILAAFLTHAADTLTLHNSSTACLHGPAPSALLTVDCYPIDPRSLVVVHRVFHGLTPRSSNCSLTSPRESCCPDPADPASDRCVFASEEEAVKARRRCDGLSACMTTSLARADVGDACPDRAGGLSYDSYSYFTFVEYSCVNVDLMSDVCDSNITQTGRALFLDSNFFSNNGNHADRTCSCVATTYCQQTLVLEVLEADLSTNTTADSCSEVVVLTEGGSGSVLATLNCSTGPRAALAYRQGGGEGGVFQSASSVVGLDLRVSGNHSGRLLIRVTATGDAPVQVVCGQPGSEDLLNETECTSSSAPDPDTKDLSSPTFNSTDEACLHGLGSISLTYSFRIDCQRHMGLISVERVFHGVTPDSLGCDSLAPKSSCCPGYNASRDCLFATDEGLTTLRKTCDGSVQCAPKLQRAAVPSGACPNDQESGLTYSGGYSSFAFVQFTCINIGLLSDFCDAGNTVRHKEVYLETNVVHLLTPEGQATASCDCVVSTACGQRLLVHLLLLELSARADGQCLGRVTIEDEGDNSVSVHLNCSHNELDETPTQTRDVVLQSQSNVLKFQLHSESHEMGKMLFKIVATEDGVVEVRCGRTTALPLWDQHQCRPSGTAASTPPSPSRSVAATATAPGAGRTSTATTGSDKDNENERGGEASNRERMIAIVAAVVAFIIVIVFIVCIVIICRGRKLGSGNGGQVDDTASVYYTHINDSQLVTDLPVSPYAIDTYSSLEPSALVSGANGEKPHGAHVYATHGGTPEDYQSRIRNTDWDSGVVEGAVGGSVYPDYPMDYDLDNVLNQSKPMPKE